MAAHALPIWTRVIAALDIPSGGGIITAREDTFRDCATLPSCRGCAPAYEMVISFVCFGVRITRQRKR